MASCSKDPDVEDEPQSSVTRSRRRSTRASTSNKTLVEVPIETDVEDNEECKICFQTKFEFVTMPSAAQPECVALTNSNLANIHTQQKDVIQHNLINYRIYDENKHMCSLDSGIMENNNKLFVTGYIKPVNKSIKTIRGGVAVMDLGPIMEWWLTWNENDDGDFDITIGVSTDYADYLLIDPHQSYKRYMDSVFDKVQLSKLVILSILNNEDDDPTYEDILHFVITSNTKVTGAKFTEEDLITHAQFVVDQVVDYDSGDTHYLPLSETQCIKTLIELSGVPKPVLSKKLKKPVRRPRRVKTKREFSKATTTELVKDVFENTFGAQLDGGNGDSVDNDDDEDDDDESTKKISAKTVFDDICNLNIVEVTTNSDICIISNTEIMWNNLKLCAKMFVVVKNNDSVVPLIGRIQYFYKKNNMDMAHVKLFLHSYETVTGDLSDPQELFSIKKCARVEINNIIKVLDVTQKIPGKNWFQLGGSKLQDLAEPVNRNDLNTFFYQHQYDEDRGSFIYPSPDNSCDVNDLVYCSNCVVRRLERKSRIPTELELIEEVNQVLYFNKFKYNNEEYKIGSFMYLQSGIFSRVPRCNFINETPFEHNVPSTSVKVETVKEVDETEYPEYYRKTQEPTLRGSNENTPNPFDIAEILAIYALPEDKKNIKIVVRRMYRAEQIPLENYATQADMNMLLWSEEHFAIQYEEIYGKCYVAFLSNIRDPLIWSAGGPDRFYFSKKYDFITGTLVPDYELPSTAKLTGNEVFVNYNYELVDSNKLQNIPSYPKIEKFKALDIFAGCGGLSRGLEDSGLIQTKWAIECDENAGTAFKLNYPKATLLKEDCNHLLKLAMAGHKTNGVDNTRIPRKGDINFICGGPPCQGFSGMNRFNSGQYSSFKNSLIVTFLAYVDFYRPKFFVIENVRTFVSFKKSAIFKLTIMCIRRMGYQCSFGILQAGNFGIPQTRRRLVILGAAPGEQLPKYPEPTHVFNRRSSHLGIQIGDKKFTTNCRYEDSAPMRTVTAYDAWSDLPAIVNGADNHRLTYNSKPVTHLQKLFRSPNNHNPNSYVFDHICKEMSPLVLARMELIPIAEGSDWRDLPNKEVELSDGTKAKKLVYKHHDIKNGDGANGALRGVCQCASGLDCNSQDRQSNTIIPWCLPHTGDRHNQWSMLYSRIGWTGFCSTTITNPEPMGKQGRVLHPNQHRVVSVRECARSQGFNDSFMFIGSVVNMHRQIGNAVPPPMGAAIGREIIKAVLSKEGRKHFR